MINKKNTHTKINPKQTIMYITKKTFAKSVHPFSSDALTNTQHFTFIVYTSEKKH